MKISISSNISLNDGVFDPGNPPPLPPGTINNLFELDVFTTSKTTFVPFEPITVQWLITQRDSDVNFADYKFSLVATDVILIDDMEQSGTEEFQFYKNTRLKIIGQKRGIGSPVTIEPAIALTVNEIGCESIEILKLFVDWEIANSVQSFTADKAEIRLRKNKAIKADWSISSLKYSLPLELVINNFFNADLDVDLTIRFSVTHSYENPNQAPELEVTIDHTLDVEFDWYEDGLSFGYSKGIEKTAKRLLPFILNCELHKIEARLVNTIISLIQSRSDTHRLLSVRIHPDGGNLAYIELVLCPYPVKDLDPDLPDAPEDGDVIG